MRGSTSSAGRQRTARTALPGTAPQLVRTATAHGHDHDHDARPARRRGPHAAGESLRRQVLADPGHRRLLGQGGSRQVDRHRQPRRRARRNGAPRWRFSTPTSTASRFRPCWASTVRPPCSATCSSRRWRTACGASRWAFSWTRTRLSCGVDRCCTRPWSSSSSTCIGEIPTSWCSTSLRAPGDVAMSIAQFVPRAEVLVVTTPQDAAERVAQRAAVLARQLRLPVQGRDREPVVVHRRRRQALRAVGSAAVASSWPSPWAWRLLAQIPFLPVLRQGRRRRGSGRGLRPGRGGRLRLSRPWPSASWRSGPGRVYRSELSVS